MEDPGRSWSEPSVKPPWCPGWVSGILSEPAAPSEVPEGYEVEPSWRGTGEECFVAIGLYEDFSSHGAAAEACRQHAHRQREIGREEALVAVLDAGEHLAGLYGDAARTLVHAARLGVQDLGDVTVRDACRRRWPIDGADAQALEHALTITEKERDQAREEGRREERARIIDIIENPLGFINEGSPLDDQRKALVAHIRRTAKGGPDRDE